MTQYGAPGDTAFIMLHPEVKDDTANYDTRNLLFSACSTQSSQLGALLTFADSIPMDDRSSVLQDLARRTAQGSGYPG